MRAKMMDEGCRKITVQSFAEYLGAGSSPDALSYLACTSLDSAFKEADFDEFDVEKWWAAARKFFKQFGMEPHPANVAKLAREI